MTLEEYREAVMQLLRRYYDIGIDNFSSDEIAKHYEFNDSAVVCVNSLAVKYLGGVNETPD